ncbi:MAG: hypothetical protein HY201_01355 [Nitrospirae bacterium]|nr:hypothetical protein [Candidatus Troglogloeales bacterium]
MGIEALGKDAFLNLLTTQLRFQDPLKPMESTEFVAQLAQFRELESSIETNKTLSTLVQGTNAMNNLGAANLIGRSVEVPGGSLLSHQSGESEKISYELDADASEVVIQVVNANGNVVRTIKNSPVQGSNQVLWDGNDNQGNKLPTGRYAYIGAVKDGDEKFTQIRVASEGEVTGVSYGDGGPFVTVNGTSVPFARIVKITK